MLRETILSESTATLEKEIGEANKLLNKTVSFDECTKGTPSLLDQAWRNVFFLISPSSNQVICFRATKIPSF